MHTCTTARIKSYDIDKLLDFAEDLPNPKHCLTLITEAMHSYNREVKRVNTPSSFNNKSVFTKIIENVSTFVHGKYNDGEETIYPPKIYTLEREFCKDIRNKRIFVEDVRDLPTMYYQVQDLFKVKNIVDCAILGDRAVHCDIHSLRALRNVLERPDIYINLFDDNNIRVDEED